MLTCIQAFVRKLFLPIHEQLGWEAKSGEADSDALLRAIVLRKLGGATHQPVIDAARAMFEKSLADPSVLPASICREKEKRVGWIRERERERKKREEEREDEIFLTVKDLRTPVYAIVSSKGDEATLNKLIDLYKKTDSAELKVILLQYVPTSFLVPSPSVVLPYSSPSLHRCQIISFVIQIL